MPAASPADLTRFLPLLKTIDRRADAMIARVIDWSAINSGSDNMAGLEKMGAVIVEAFSALGCAYQRHDLDDVVAISPKGEEISRPLGPAHHFIKRPDAERRILLTGHLDTVFPNDSPFQKAVWRDDQTLNGPGVADMKGGLIVMLEALMALEQSGVADGLGYEILISADEEIGSLGSARLLADRAPFADFGMTYEPALADGTLAGARKGSGNFTLAAFGRAAHAGRDFASGRNAVVAMAALISELDALNGRRAGVTVNPAVVTGGVAPNIVPDVAVLRFNIRVDAAEDCRWVEAELRRILDGHAARDGFRFSLHGGFNRPPKPLSPANIHLFETLAACGRTLGLDLSWQPTGGCCEGNNLAAAGLPNIDTLGVRGGKIHSPDEFVLTDSFGERAKLSALLLLGFAGGGLESLRRTKRR